MLAYTELVRYPGNEALHLALEISVLGAARGHPMHVHAEGLRGTGKTTVIRAAAALLPPIRRIAGCPYNCEPARPHCPLHRDLSAADVANLGAESIPAPFLEISPSAKLGTVVGSIDLGRLTDPARPAAALLPGTLARAHRGVVFVDEINRLADTGPELADALLDVMGTKPGRLQIEEAGLPAVSFPCRVTVWAASNPDEEPGPLADVRRQLADRFDMAVAMRRPAEPAVVMAVLGGDDAFADFPAPRMRPAGEPAPALLGLGAGVPVPPLPGELRDLLARIFCDFQLESLRAVQAWQAASRLLALRAGKPVADREDLRRTAPFVLRHRLEPEDLARLLDHLERSELPPAQAALAAAAPFPVAVPAPGMEASRALAEAVGTRRPWWQRWRRGGGGGVAGVVQPQPWRLADPAELPVITPRHPARLLGELGEDALVTPSVPVRRPW